MIEQRRICMLTIKNDSGRSNSGVSNIQRAGQNRPVAMLDPARGMILQSKNVFVCLRSISSHTSINWWLDFNYL